MHNLWHIPSNKLFLIRTSMQGPVMFSRKVQTSTYEIVKGSYVPLTRANKTETANQETMETVGAFQRLPMVKPPLDILYSALRKAKKVPASKGISNIAKRERNRGAKQLDALMKELAIPLREYMDNFPNKKHLHPYERSLIELTLGDGNYEEVLERVKVLKKKVVSVGKEQASLCAKCLTKHDAEERLDEGIKKLEEIFNREGKAVDDLLNIAKVVTNFPAIK
ncbi:hypothetical protein IFM89_033220 [Coptis chinensis]|uniref:NOG1 N-terminal helical domain-containing protein n=1 Tax=Coptis chinensis TaxID=261450 RepID=A0A835IYG1_9MAGN|nr:hypothetical protein IFM89_033220 [Coptis chinensis]